jgi:RHS repeat-associated protein
VACRARRSMWLTAIPTAAPEEHHIPLATSPAKMEYPSLRERCIELLPGQYFDKETNLHYNYFRDYDPAIGRYIQADPIGLESGINLYSYVDSNPLSYYDPNGQAKTGVQIGGAIGGGIGAVVGGVIGGSGGAIGGTAVAPGPGTFGGGAYGAVQGAAIGAGVGTIFGAAVGSTIEDIVTLMAAPGNVADTQIVGAYNRYASEQRMCGKQPMDRCEWLRQNQHRFRPDQVKATQKAWGCRRSRASR